MNVRTLYLDHKDQNKERYEFWKTKLGARRLRDSDVTRPLDEHEEADWKPFSRFTDLNGPGRILLIWHTSEGPVLDLTMWNAWPDSLREKLYVILISGGGKPPMPEDLPAQRIQPFDGECYPNTNDDQAKRFLDFRRHLEETAPSLQPDWRVLNTDVRTEILSHLSALSILLQGALTVFGLERDDPWWWYPEEWCSRERPVLDNEARERSQKALSTLKSNPSKWFQDAQKDLSVLFPNGGEEYFRALVERDIVVKGVFDNKPSRALIGIAKAVVLGGQLDEGADSVEQVLRSAFCEYVDLCQELCV